MFDRVKAVLAQVWAWVKSPRGRIVWIRVLFAPVLVWFAPVVAGLWRILLSGDPFDQAVIVAGIMLFLLARSGVRRWRRLAPGRQGEEPASKAKSERRRRRSA